MARRTGRVAAGVVAAIVATAAASLAAAGSAPGHVLVDRFVEVFFAVGAGVLLLGERSGLVRGPYRDGGGEVLGLQDRTGQSARFCTNNSPSQR